MYPLFLNLANRLCVVVGGGAVGRRKMSGLLDSGAQVRLVCLEPRPPEVSLSNLEWLTEPYRSEHLHGAALVFAAATPEINRQVVLDARAGHIWVNSATDPPSGDFFVPATIRRDDFVVSVGTKGAAPALAQTVRAFLDSQFDEAFGQWVRLLGVLRPTVRAAVSDPQRRRELLQRLSDWHWLERLRREEFDSVRAAMLATIQDRAGISDDPL